MFRFLSIPVASHSIRPILLLAARSAPIPLLDSVSSAYHFAHRHESSSCFQDKDSITIDSISNLKTGEVEEHKYPADIQPSHEASNSLIDPDVNNRVSNENIADSPTTDTLCEQNKHQTSSEIAKFRELGRLLSINSPLRNNRAEFFKYLPEILDMFDVQSVRDGLEIRDLSFYSSTILNAALALRHIRLNDSKNRDRDQLRGPALFDDAILKRAIVHLQELIQEGEFEKRLCTPTIRSTILSLLEFRFFPEIMLLWETGVNSETDSGLYLGQEILSIIFPVAYKSNRFSYNDILQIWTSNVGKDNCLEALACSIGKIAVAEGDYARGLDSMEILYKSFEDNKCDYYALLTSCRYLRDLHLTFIGSCKQISIASSFFSKIVSGRLPYEVHLKVPHVVLLLENCVTAQEPFSVIEGFWRQAVNVYATDRSTAGSNNSRYLILNNCFFKIFFTMNPKLTEDSLAQLKSLIATYASIKQVDEMFLNTVITNYSWKNKQVFDEIVKSYDLYDVYRTPVLYRVCLKNTGCLPLVTPENILKMWLESLAILDAQKYTYIPIADWAALRSATIFSEYESDRSALYYEIVKHYCNYMQDRSSCIRFLSNFIDRPQVFKQLARLNMETNPDFGSSIPVVPGNFEYLQPNIDYRKFTSDLASSKSSTM